MCPPLVVFTLTWRDRGKVTVLIYATPYCSSEHGPVPCPGYMAAHGDNAYRPTNKPPIRFLLRLLFFRNEKILFITCCVLKICYYLCIGPLLVRGLDPTFRQSWLCQVCLSYVKAISANLIVGAFIVPYCTIKEPPLLLRRSVALICHFF